MKILSIYDVIAFDGIYIVVYWSMSGVFAWSFHHVLRSSTPREY